MGGDSSVCVAAGRLVGRILRLSRRLGRDEPDLDIDQVIARWERRGTRSTMTSRLGRPLKAG